MCVPWKLSPATAGPGLTSSIVHLICNQYAGESGYTKSLLRALAFPGCVMSSATWVLKPIGGALLFACLQPICVLACLQPKLSESQNQWPGSHAHAAINPPGLDESVHVRREPDLQTCYSIHCTTSSLHGFLNTISHPSSCINYTNTGTFSSSTFSHVHKLPFASGVLDLPILHWMLCNVFYLSSSKCFISVPWVASQIPLWTPAFTLHAVIAWSRIEAFIPHWCLKCRHCRLKSLYVSSICLSRKVKARLLLPCLFPHNFCTVDKGNQAVTTFVPKREWRALNSSQEHPTNNEYIFIYIESRQKERGVTADSCWLSVISN